MKFNKMIVASSVLTVAFFLFSAINIYAQDTVDFDIWVGQWYKGAVVDNGLIVDNDGTSKTVEAVPTYGYVVSWDATNQQFFSLLIQYNNTTQEWMDAVPYVLKVIGGTPLDYASYSFIPPGSAPGIEFFAISLNITGQVKNGILKEGTAKSIGGLVIYDNGDGSYFSAEESLHVKVIPEWRVPEEIKAIKDAYLTSSE